MNPMYKKISKTTEINARLQEEGKVTPLNTVGDISRLTSMNEYMEDVRKEYHMKESRSQISASRIVLNA